MDEPDLVETDGRTIFSVAEGAPAGHRRDRRGPADRGSMARRHGGHGPPAGRRPAAGDRRDGGGGAWYGRRPGGRRGHDGIAPAARRPATVLVRWTCPTPRRRGCCRGCGSRAAWWPRGARGTSVRVVVSSTAARLPLVQPSSSGATAAGPRRAPTGAPWPAPTPTAWLPRITVRDVAPSDRAPRAVGCRSVSRPAQFAGVGMVSVLTVGATDTLTPARHRRDPDRRRPGLRLPHLALRGDPALGEPAARRVVRAAPRHDPDPQARHLRPRAHDLPRERRGARLPAQPVLALGVRRATCAWPAPRSRTGGARRTPARGPARAWSPCSPSATAAWRGGRRWTGSGSGERIYAVRFLGARGYVVTFRQTDPLFTLDLSDPAHPARARRAEDPGLLVLPAPDRRDHADRRGPGRGRRRAHAGDPGVAVRRLRPGGAAADRPADARHATGPRPSPTTTPFLFWCAGRPARASGPGLRRGRRRRSSAPWAWTSPATRASPRSPACATRTTSPRCAARWWWATRSTRSPTPGCWAASSTPSPRGARPRSTERPRRRRRPAVAARPPSSGTGRTRSRRRAGPR